ncbi:hypothetical protein KCU78_g5325, partial [Aureobasidium melanogenum]
LHQQHQQQHRRGRQTALRSLAAFVHLWCCAGRWALGARRPTGWSPERPLDVRATDGNPWTDDYDFEEDAANLLQEVLKVDKHSHLRPTKIVNPNYFVEKTPSKFKPKDAIVFELWTLQNDILFEDSGARIFCSKCKKVFWKKDKHAALHDKEGPWDNQEKGGTKAVKAAAETTGQHQPRT